MRTHLPQHAYLTLFYFAGFAQPHAAELIATRLRQMGIPCLYVYFRDMTLRETQTGKKPKRQPNSAGSGEIPIPWFDGRGTIYIVMQSQEAADRTLRQCTIHNPVHITLLDLTAALDEDEWWKDEMRSCL